MDFSFSCWTTVPNARGGEKINYLAYGGWGRGRRVSYFPGPLGIYKPLPNYPSPWVHCHSLKGLASRAVLVTHRVILCDCQVLKSTFTVAIRVLPLALNSYLILKQHIPTFLRKSSNTVGV